MVSLSLGGMDVQGKAYWIWGVLVVSGTEVFDREFEEG